MKKRRAYTFVSNKTGYRRSKVCPLAEHTIEDIDYKNKELLSKFTSDYGRILPKRLTGVSAKKQRKLRLAIIRARFLALVPYCTKKF
jgi:small subunit ribosomal protein S18